MMVTRIKRLDNRVEAHLSRAVISTHLTRRQFGPRIYALVLRMSEYRVRAARALGTYSMRGMRG